MSTCKNVKLRRAIKVALSAAIAAPLAFAALPAAAQSSNVQAQIQQLQQQLNQLEAQQKQSAGNVKVGNTSVNISGYVKLDTFYDFDADQGSSLGPSQTLNADAFAGYPDGEGHLGMTAKESRVNIATDTPTSIGDVKGFLQFDMYGGGSIHNDSTGGLVRMRLAYLTVGNWLFGRAWTPFANFNYGFTANFYGPAGQTFGRMEQIRYTWQLAGGDTFAVALQDDSDAQHVAGLTIDDEQTTSPGLAASYNGSAGIFSYQAAGYIGQLKANSGTGSDSSMPWAANVGGTLALHTGTSLMATVAYGKGAGNLIYTPLQKAQAEFGPNSDLNLNKQLGVTFSVNQKFNDQWSGNLVTGYSQAESGIDSSSKVQGESAAVNVVYSPVDQLLFALEYDWVKSKVKGANAIADFGGALAVGPGSGHTQRVQFSAKYNF